MVGRLMKRASWIVRGIVMDAHQSNSFVRGGIFGDFSSLSPKILEDIPWFQDLSFHGPILTNFIFDVLQNQEQSQNGL